MKTSHTSHTSHTFLPGFTLVELLIVIGIIAILSGVLLTSGGKAAESARAAKCLSNMKNLAVFSGPAASKSKGQSKVNKSAKRFEVYYVEEKGWISGDSRGLFPSKNKQDIPPIGLYEENRETALYAVTNGWMYGCLGGNASALVCPVHAAKKPFGAPHWSYFKSGGVEDPDDGERKGTASLAENTLAYAEIPFQGAGSWFPKGSAATTETDAVLEIKKSTHEHIGGNHKAGGKWMAHVAFADGHVEKLNVDGLSDQELKELTRWLAFGFAISRRGKKYEKIDN